MRRNTSSAAPPSTAITTTTVHNSVNKNSDTSNMEPSFYEDSTPQRQSSPQFSTPNNSNNTNSNSSNGNGNIKRPLSLDLNSKTPAKKQRLNQTVATTIAGGGGTGAATSTPTPLVLESPDLQVLKFNTPDLEKFILANANLQTPTPSIVFPTKVTSEQEDYAKGFEDALNSLRNSDNSQNNLSINTTTSSVVSGMSGGSITYTNLDEMPVAIKDEPQTVPNSPPLSPIDMEDQERIKLERKRQRNRVAASKCRKRKLERISKLEDKVKSLKGENAELASLIKKLKEHVCLLKQQVMDHVHAGCSLINSNSILQVK